MSTELTLKPGPGGWVMAHDSRSGIAFVHFRRESERWARGPIFLPGEMTPELLRVVPLRRIELAVSASHSISSALVQRLEEESPPLGSSDFYAAFSGYMTSEPIKLERPKTHRLDDDWYRRVADAYRQAVERGLNPRAAIADAAGVSRDVAGRWIAEARKPSRGFLPKTKPGMVTADARQGGEDDAE